MSSPLSMLKKIKRVPLDQQGGRERITFRRNHYTEYVADEIKQPDQAADNASIAKLKVSQKKGTPPSDLELMSKMMQRLNQLESKVNSQALEIKSKEKQIVVLKQRLNLLKTPEEDLNDRDELVRTCHQLQSQVFQMESFLNDYGMIWVGENGDSSITSKEKREEAGNPQNQRTDRYFWLSDNDTSLVRNFRIDFDLILRNINDLNILAGEGELYVQPTATGAQLAKKVSIPLRLYKNGILMFDGPFRSYEEPSTQQCMQDLMDGYFPSELKNRFPDGVPFEVADMRNEDYVVRQPWTLSSQIKLGRKFTMDQFLNKLPKMVVKAGRVIDIRDSVKATLQGSSDNQTNNYMNLIDTPALRAMNARMQKDDFITLRVKSELGDHNYILKMYVTETIGQLRQYLDKHRGEGSEYDVISAFPRQCFNDDSQTLLSCGLSPNAVLLLRTKQCTHNPFMNTIS